eukprot:gnl/TRDRNA2_/TRDRNA2_74833_c0_seq1.p1 gnl/TRDRNA2_/TRDRNA2_74833_c0~~gnl/TRDRNA2_/TRDRNA2_74833_c0_seq1.p1  ORF type:complete len:172 (+),score=27.68 gnl/TRDRNA2_/TRDRNA2_74833_c0_seq1:29-544(+)
MCAMPAASSRSWPQGEWVEIQTRQGEVISSPNSLSCEFYIDVHFEGAAANDIAGLVFQNHYTAFVTLEQLLAKDPSAERLHREILPKKRLMHDPHCEDDAQAWHAVYRNQFVQPLVDAEVDRPKQDIVIRMKMLQPSPNWRSFRLRNIKAYRFLQRQAIPAVISSGADLRM